MLQAQLVFPLVLRGVSEKATKQQTQRKTKEWKGLTEANCDFVNNILHLDFDTTRQERITYSFLG
jgi:hypothetical protein